MTSQTSQEARSLRNLYLTRTLVQILWAVAVIRIAPNNLVLLILYPLWDVACTFYDLKTSVDPDTAKTQSLNAIAGILTALAIGLAGRSHLQYTVAIFGIWALLAGLLQLAAGILRRQRLGGQWAMILSGAQSTLAGVAFTLGGLSGKFHIKDLGGYAVFGAVYFLIGAIFLGRKLNIPVGSQV